MNEPRASCCGISCQAFVTYSWLHLLRPSLTFLVHPVAQASRNCFVLLYVRTEDGSGASAMSAEFQEQVKKIKISNQQQTEGDDWEQASLALIDEAQSNAPAYIKVKAAMEQLSESGHGTDLWPDICDRLVRDLSDKHKCSQRSAAKAIDLAMCTKKPVDSEHGAGADLIGTSPPLSTAPDLAMWNGRGTWNMNPDIPDRKLVSYPSGSSASPDRIPSAASAAARPDQSAVVIP